MSKIHGILKNAQPVTISMVAGDVRSVDQGGKNHTRRYLFKGPSRLPAHGKHSSIHQVFLVSTVPAPQERGYLRYQVVVFEAYALVTGGQPWAVRETDKAIPRQVLQTYMLCCSKVLEAEALANSTSSNEQVTAIAGGRRQET